MKKRAVMLVSLVLVLALGIYMIAFAENDALSLYTEAKTLLFDTTNVSLSAEATFKYDGELFKTLHGEYKQDDINSFLRIMLDTPNADGSVYTGGYTVVGNGSTVYSNDTKNGNYYVVSPGAVEKTLLQQNPSLMSSLDLVEAGLRAISSQLDKYIAKQTAADGSGVYELKLDGAPEFLNAAATFFAQRYFDREYGYLYYYDYGTHCRGEVADFDKLFAFVYEQAFAEKMPENYIENTDSFTEEDWEKYSAVVERIYADLDAETEKYSNGVLLAHSDGTYKWFADSAEYMRTLDIDYVYYDDYTSAVALFYEQKYGKPLTNDDMFVISNTGNDDLWNAYYKLTCEMDEYYRELAKQNPETVAIIVGLDGTYKEFKKDPYDTYNRTLTQSIIASFSKLEIASVDVTVTDDANGRITGAEGNVELAVTDKAGIRHSLEIELDLNVYDYDTTEVKEFDPAEYGFVTFDEYLETLGVETEMESEVSYIERLMNAPETIEFAGETFETNVYIWEINED